MLESEESKHPKRVINNYVGLWRKTIKKIEFKKLKQPLASKVYNQFLEKMLSVFNKLILLRLLWVLYIV